ncbi:MAG: methyltransferase domain-containing protein [Acidobacteriota bacterium]
MTYDHQYSEVEALFGTEPERSLKRFSDQLKPGSTVLDIGAGHGRNALFLARQGITVQALEPSGVAAAELNRIAETEALPLEVFPTTFEEFVPSVDSYAGLLIFGLMPDLGTDAILDLAMKIDRWSGPETLVWLTGFTTEDPAYPHHRASWTAVGKNSFLSPEGRIRTYLEPGEILRLFEDLSPLHHWEGLGPEHRHGDGPLERHGLFEVVLRKAPAEGSGGCPGH